MKSLFNKYTILGAALLCGLRGYTQSMPLVNGNGPAVNNAPKTPTNFVPASNAFNSGGNTAPTLFNITRSWALKTPVTDVSSLGIGSTTEAAIATTYTNGWGNVLQTVQRKSNFDHDLIIPGDNRASTTTVNLLPYSLSTMNVGPAHFQPNMFVDQSNYYKQIYTDEGNTAYSATKELSAFSQNSYMPGASFVGADNATVTDVTSYMASDILMWNVDNSGACYVNNNYSNGTLTIKTTRLDKHVNAEFYDKDGRLICKYASDNGKLRWTYYAYDEMGKLRCVIPPKAMDLYTGGYLDQNLQKNLCYTYTYDDHGLLIQSTTPGKANPELVIYDTKHRPVLTQSAQQANDGLWSFAIYDHMDRKVLTGVTTQNVSLTDWQNVASTTYGAAYGDQTYLSHYIANGFNDGDYQLIQNYTISDAQIYTINYYDNYDLDADLAGRTFASYGPDYENGAGTVFPYKSNNTYGLLTGKKVFIPNSPYQRQWISSVYFYDRDGRLIETQTQNPFNDNNQWDNIALQYDFSGRLIQSINDHKAWSTADRQSTKIMTRYGYDPSYNKLTSVTQKTDTDPTWVKLTSNTYNDLGQLKEHTMGDVETQKLNYNIRGQLAGINKDYVYNSSCTGCGSMNFGTDIHYDYGFLDNTMDGSISGIIWRGSGTSLPAAYGYNYDALGQLTGADYNQQTSAYGQPAWTNNDMDYSVSNINYDANGNMLSLKQKGSPWGSGALDIDDLSYEYFPGTNLLKGVSDNVTTNYGMGDFQDGNPGTSDYDYDTEGNLKADLNKNISQIEYNVFNQPTAIHSSQGNITNVYAADGTLLEKRTESYAAGTTSTQRYWGPFVYQDDKLQYALNAEGRCRWEAANNAFKYDYFVKDHLGNVRSTVTADQGSFSDFLNTNEIAVAPLEGRFFDGIAPVRDDNPLTNDPNDLKCSRLNGSDPARRIGPSLLVRVMSGDVFDVSCNSFYEAGTGNDNVSADAGSMMQSIIGTLSGSGIGGGYTAGEGVDPNQVATSLFNTDNYLNVYDALKEQQTNPELPRAYLNYLVFDENMQLVPEESGAIQITAGANAWQALGTNSSIKIGRNGYLSVYVSNEQYHDIYFDNLYLRHWHGRLLQEEQYYPHGLAVNMGSNTPLDNNFQYQGNEKHDELGIGLSDFHARQYDAQLGRFWSIDPMNQFASGYIGMGNNPANLVDPMGMQTNGAGAAASDLRGIRYTRTDFDWMDGIPHNSFVYGWGTEGGATKYIDVAIGEMVPGQGLSNVHVETDLSKFGIEWSPEYHSFGYNTTTPSQIQGTVNAEASEGPGRTAAGNIGVKIGQWVSVPFNQGMQNFTLDALAKQGNQSSSESALSEFWNSPIARLVVPDKLNFNLSGDIAAFVGVGASPINLTLLTRGKEPGLYLTPTFQVSAGTQIKAEASINLSVGYYTGDPREITSDMLTGPTQAVGASVKILVGGSGEISWSEAGPKEYFINFNGGVGVGGAAAAYYQYQYTPGAGPLFTW